MAEVLVYRGTGVNGTANFGHLLGTNYTFEIGDIDADTNWSHLTNGMYQAGNGFVFRGSDTDGFNENLTYSDGTNSQAILYDENGNYVLDPTAFAAFGTEAVFLANTDSVSGTAVQDRAFMITNGGNAPELLLSVPISSYILGSDNIYAFARSGDFHVVRPDLSSSVIYEADENDLYIDYFFEFDGALYIRANDGFDNDFYRVDPDTATLTKMSIAENGGGDSVYFYYAGVGDDQFYFWLSAPYVHGVELYVSDGTSAGTQLVQDINPGTGSSVNHNYYGGAATIGNKLIFIATEGGIEGYELWVSDGTSGGTFALSGAGTNAGNLGFTHYQFQPLTAGNLTYFEAFDSEAGNALFVTDGTIAGTKMLMDLNEINDAYSKSNLFVVDGTFYFSPNNGLYSGSVWTSDGTVEGTVLVSDALPSSNAAYAPQMLNVVELDEANIPTPTYTGGSSSESFTGEDLDELFEAGSGDDTIVGGDGNDTVSAGDGDDQIWAGATDTGSDEVSGGAGSDTIGGGGGADTLNGDDDGDLLFGGDDGDTINCGSGNDIAWAGLGNDSVSGGAGNDIFGGGAGHDTLAGGNGNDTIYAAAGNDEVTGGNGNDQIFGGEGNDTLTGGSGNDSIFGGSGNDTLIFGTSHGDDYVGGFKTKGDNTIDLSALNLSGFGALGISQSGADVVIDTGEGTITMWNTNSSDVTSDDFLF